MVGPECRACLGPWDVLDARKEQAAAGQRSHHRVAHARRPHRQRLIAPLG